MVDKIWYNMEELVGGSEERVLIETYWNVNPDNPRNICRNRLVLIETYWNVNMIRKWRHYRAKRVLIETYWNVNASAVSSVGKSTRRINRNILECKFILLLF